MFTKAWCLNVAAINMIKFNIKNREKISPDQLILLQNLQEKCDGIIANILRKQDFEHLKVSSSYSVEDKKGNDCFLLTDNSSFKMRNSLTLANAVNSFLKESNIDLILPENKLNVKLNFVEKDMAQEKNEKTEKKNDGLPDFFPQKPRFNFNQIILPNNVRKEVYDALKVIECKELIYNDWGFGEVDSIPRSILNLYGDPGTGKTMCAHAIADYLGKPLLALNYSEIESKYVGDAPKNLKKAFDTAKETDSVLFFDEADSFLGKRIQNVSQGAEQALNSLRSQMLILLEEFPGVIVFATNLVSNFDRAFESRILKHIKFELPNEEARVAIIKKMLPKNLPVNEAFTDEQILEASKMIDGFSGREIKTAILDMLLGKATLKEKVIFSIDDLFAAFKAKKESIEQMKAEEKKIIKEKIIKKLSGKGMEQEEEERIAAEKKNQKDDGEKNSESCSNSQN